MAYVQTITTTRRMQTENIGAQVVWLLFSTIEVILLVRFILMLMGASAGAMFTQFVYSLSEPLMAPFQSVIPSSFIQGNAVIEWNALIALVVYWVLAWVLSSLFYNFPPAAKSETREELREIKREEKQ